jgi:hypothetical protein
MAEKKEKEPQAILHAAFLRFMGWMYKYILNTPQYLAESKRYAMHSLYTNPKTGYVTNYETLPTYIRNAIDHPNSGNTYTDEQLAISTELLRSLL